MDGKKCFRKKNKNHQLNFLQPRKNEKNKNKKRLIVQTIEKMKKIKIKKKINSSAIEKMKKIKIEKRLNLKNRKNRKK